MKLASMLLAASLTAIAQGAPAAKPAPHSRIPYRTVVESAWAAALRPENATGGTCATKIGRRSAAALAKYCKEYAPTQHARCNSANACQVLTDAIYGYCTDIATDADPQVKFGGIPDPKHLPCVDLQKSAEDWEGIRRAPAR